MPYTFNPFTGNLDAISIELPAGADTNVQYNDNGAFGGDSGFTYDKTTGDVENSGKLTCGGSTSGQSIIARGLVVNEAGGNTSLDDLRVETTNEADAFFVDAAKDTVNIGVGITNPILTKVNDYTLTNLNHTILADATSNTVTITLPTNPIAGIIYNIKCINSTNTCTINRNSKNIDGDASNIILIEDEIVTLQYDGTEWWII